MKPLLNPANYRVPAGSNTFELAAQTVSDVQDAPGVLLIHGFTGDTSEMRPLAEEINSHLGLYCYAPLLPGHGLPPHELHGITDTHWLEAAHAGYEHVRARHNRVIVVSFSMGAALAAIMLAETHADPVAYIAIAPMITTRFPLLPFAPLVSRFIPFIYPLKFVPIDLLGIRGKIQQYDPSLDLDDPQVVEQLKAEIRIPIAVAEELRKIAKRAINAAHHITVPTLVVQGERDLTLDPDGARRFYRALRSADKNMLSFAGADHDFVKAKRPGNSLLVTTVSGWIRQRFC
jgi:carboxylesterase